jgi:predicted nucleotidyltransferase
VNIDVWKHYAGNLPWLKERTIVLMKHGSHAYGTNGPTSDIDVKGVCIAPPEILFGFVQTFEQADKGFGELDCCIYELRKIMKLAADNNPNCIELPFVDESDWLEVTPAWLRVVENRDLFLSRNAKHRFCGYAMAQLKRIRSHREWLLSPPTHQPTREEFGLPQFTSMSVDQRQAAEDQVKKQIEAWSIDLADVDDGLRISLLEKYRDSLTEIAAYSGMAIEDAAAKKLGFSENFIEYLGHERAYRSAMSRWKQYLDWQKNRNEKRSELERKYGYDTKHGMHLVRLMRMAREILLGKGVIVKRPDAEELKAIRNGAMTFDQLMAWAEPREAELEELMVTSPLPKQPNRTKLDELCREIVAASL